jgi:hypothetical protein
MAKITIPCLVSRTNKGGVTSWYWQPSATLKAAGWHPVALGRDEGAAIAVARARNAEVAAWKLGGVRPAEVAQRNQSGTVGSLIARYRREVIHGTRPEGGPCLADSTITLYQVALKRLDMWAGKQPLAFVTPARVQALKKAMLQPKDKGGIGHDPAHKTLKMGRTLFKFAIECDLVDRNPFDKFGLSAPPPRSIIWSPPAREAMIAAAHAAGKPSIAAAFMLGYSIAQREADLLKLSTRNYVPIPAHKMQPEDWRIHTAIAPDGIPMGIRVRQNKTKAWIEVPIVGEVRAMVEARIAAATAGGSTSILIDDSRGQPGRAHLYHGKTGQSRFQRDIADIRDAAAAKALEENDKDLAAEIATLQFRDLRRTCVVYLGELGFDAHQIASITGHDLDEVQAILKTYMPRTTAKAAHVIAMTHLREQREADIEAEQKASA